MSVNHTRTCRQTQIENNRFYSLVCGGESCSSMYTIYMLKNIHMTLTCHFDNIECVVFVTHVFDNIECHFEESTCICNTYTHTRNKYPKLNRPVLLLLLNRYFFLLFYRYMYVNITLVHVIVSFCMTCILMNTISVV